MMDRRSFIRSGALFVACAPAIVRATSLMPVKAVPQWHGIKAWWGGEARQFEIEEIATWFSVPPYLIGDVATFGGNSYAARADGFLLSLNEFVSEWSAR